VLTIEPQAEFEEMKARLVDQIGKTFPIRDRRGKYEVRVSDVTVSDDKGVGDLKGQHDARMNGKSWAAPVTGKVSIFDVETGKSLAEKKVQLASIPKLTRHYSYIIGGQEKFVTKQWRLRPGVYVKATEKPGEYEAQFQLAKGAAFDIQQGPEGYLHLKVGGRKVPLYSVLHAYGVSDEAMKQAWGDTAFATTKAKSVRGKENVDKHLRSFYEAWSGRDLPEKEDPKTAVQSLFEQTKVDPAVVKANLGVESSGVNPAILLAASKKLINVAGGYQQPDPIDSLRYKELWSAKDHFAERLAGASEEIQSRVSQVLGKPTVQKKLMAGDAEAIRDVVPPDLIRRPFYSVFTTSLSANGKQTNPVSMLSDRSMVTIQGPGGITNPHSITKSNTAIDPSHLGILDPVFTPESNPGVNTHLTFGVGLKDRKPHVSLYNIKTKKIEDVDATTAATSNVVLPDQVVWKGGNPAPRSKSVRMSDSGGELRDDLPWSSAQYVMPSASQVFATETNLVPFMQNDAAGRTTMSARHMAQAISIEGREPPKVQVEAGAGRTFENLIGSGFLAHKSPVDGTVRAVRGREILIQDSKGKEHSVHLYNHYPTNDPKGMLHSEPLVKEGARVKAGQVLADNNFTKNGTLALGTNLRTAYLANGSNHEDGIVISETAAQKLRSVHLNKPMMMVSDDMIIDKNKFVNNKDVYGSNRMAKIGDDGIVKKGAIVHPGDPLVLSMSKRNQLSSIDENTSLKLGGKLRQEFMNSSLVWDSDHPGEVIDVARSGRNIIVHVKTREPAQVGSKVSTRHSAKGIVTSILPDKEMPHDAAGKPVEMLINPVSVPGRMNPGQILETAAGKIADKTGQPYVVKNFQGGVDYLKKVQDDLKKHGLSDTETLFDPKTGRKLGDIATGPHYVFQLEHQIDKKTHVRSGGRAFTQFDAPMIHYDNDTKIPRGGGHTGAQSLGSLGVYGALAAGLNHNLAEMQTLKADKDQAREVWGALINGEQLPPPKVPFVYHKFENMLKGLGVDMHKNGTSVRMIPRTDAETRKVSAGELTKASKGRWAEGDEPVKGGLFDRNITGGPAGQRWSHIELVEPMPNPVFSKAIAHTLGIKETDIPDIIEGKKKLPDGGYGGKGFRDALSKLDINKEIEKAREELKDPKLKGTALDKVNFKLHALVGLKDVNKSPADAWTMKALPVLPPIYRQQGMLPDGTVKVNPLNSLYRRLAMTNESLQKGEKHVPYNATLDTRRGLYNSMTELFGTAAKGKKGLDLDVRGTKEDPNKKLPGIIHMISGDQPKDGFFQDKLIGKKQDYTARATIVVDPTLSVEEIGVPKKIAVELMRPMVSRRLQALGYSPGQAETMISHKHETAIKALEKEVQTRPILLKRDPVLHQYGIIGQHIKLTNEPAIKVNPLVLPPLNGDIDGDTIALMVPLTPHAVAEAKRVLPSQRTLSDSSGDVLYTPSNEAALALYRMSIPRGDHGKTFKSKDEAEQAFRQNKLNLNEAINISGVGKTTLGRARIAQVVPEKYRHDVLTNLDRPFDKKVQSTILSEVAKGQPHVFVPTVDGLSRLGFQMAYESGHTVTLKDLEPLRDARGQVIEQTRKEVEKLVAGGKHEAVTEKWLGATRQLHDIYNKHYQGNPTHISDMSDSGIKAKREQFQGLVMAPMLVEDHLGRPSRVPLTTSFSEGVDLGGYFVSAAGARRGVIQKTDSVREPGYMSKLLVQANIDQPISGMDCGTTSGVSLPLADKDIVDRRLAVDTNVGGRLYRAGTVVTPSMLSEADKARMNQLVVRSPLKCRMPTGVCSHCMGVHPGGHEYAHGENAGVIAAHALGERAAQIMLKQTHGQGIVSTKGQSVAVFGDVQRMFNAAKRSMMDAAVAPTHGNVTKVERSREGVWSIHMDGVRKPVETRQKPLEHVAPGYRAQRGEVLTKGDPNVNDLMATQGIDATQQHMVKKIGDIYAAEGVLRRHVELAVRSSTGVARITDPGDHAHYLRGDFAQRTVLDELNRSVLSGKKPIQYTSVITPVGSVPERIQPDWMGRLQGENLSKTIRRAAQHLESADVRGKHPIPRLAYGQYIANPHGTN
jgi:DNA-directed RNA polymerase subunit beta'